MHLDKVTPTPRLAAGGGSQADRLGHLLDGANGANAWAASMNSGAVRVDHLSLPLAFRLARRSLSEGSIGLQAFAPPRGTSADTESELMNENPSRRPAAGTWLLAIRPATLPASISGVVVGLGAAWGSGAPLRLDAALGCLAVALLLQICANLANDLSDFRRGADTPDRLGPTRVAAAGLATPRQLQIAIAVVIAIAGIVGGWLAIIGGPAFAALGVAAIAAALLYTGGPLPYGYRGLGEPFVFVFFGLVAVVGTAELQTGHIEVLFVLAAVPVGALTTAILVVNNLRDIATDRAADKRTLGVMFGGGFARAEYLGCLVAAWIVPVGLAAGHLWSGSIGRGPAILLPLLALPLAVPLWRTVHAGGDPRLLNPVLRGTARLTLVFALLFAVGLAGGG
jgi:1,4-dihydroxy-2-naphthoate octaprenyltransferase